MWTMMMIINIIIITVTFPMLYDEIQPKNKTNNKESKSLSFVVKELIEEKRTSYVWWLGCVGEASLTIILYKQPKMK